MPDFGLTQTFASQPALFIGCCALLGLLVGSFLNVVIYRLPIMMENELRAECRELADAEAEQASSPTDAPPTVVVPEPASAIAPAMAADAEAAIESVVERAANAALEPASPPLEALEAVAPAAAGSPADSALLFDPAETPEPAPFNLVVPRSACPHCKAPITALQNVPVVSWLVLGGKCANCQAPISMRYPLVELATGALTGFVAWRFGFGFTAMAAILFTWFAIALTMIDFDTQYLPDALTYPLLWLGLLASLWHPAWGPGALPVGPEQSIIGAIAGYLSLWSVYWAFKLLTGKEGMGYGDFKLLAALGAWLGWQMLLPVILMASGVGALFGIVYLVQKRKGRDTQIPFGPFLAVAGWIALVAGNAVLGQYFVLFEY